MERYYVRDDSGVVFTGASWDQCAAYIRSQGWDVYDAIETGRYTITTY